MASHGPLARIDELGLSNLKNKLNDLKDLKAKFLDDFADATDDILRQFDRNTRLVEGWKVLREAGETRLGDRIDDIIGVDYYLKNNPTKTTQNVVDDIKNKGWQKWSDEVIEVTVTGKFEPHELKQAKIFGKENGGGTLHFNNSEQGIEGIFTSISGQVIPISFKELPTPNPKNVFRSINENSKQISKAQSISGTEANKYCKIGSNPNTYIRVDATGVSKQQLLSYYKSIPEERRILLFGKSGIYKEIKIVANDGGKLIFKNYTLIE